jgi:hypothetical protein
MGNTVLVKGVFANGMVPTIGNSGVWRKSSWWHDMPATDASSAC